MLLQPSVPQVVRTQYLIHLFQMDNYYIGLMSGTSLDAIDAVLIRIEDKGEIEIVSLINTPLPVKQNHCTNSAQSIQSLAKSMPQLH